MHEVRRQAQAATALALGVLILYTAAAGSFASLVQRPVFLAFVVVLGLLHHPLGSGSSWRPLGLVVDIVLGVMAVASCAWVAWNEDEIMTSLPEATTMELAMAIGLVAVILELSRRAIGLVFPAMVMVGLAYAFLGNHIPGSLGHRGFDLQFIAETLLLSDIGLWGTLLGVASTVIAVFALFGSFLLHSGGGQSFMNMALRVSGRSTGGAAKIATVASGIFGMVSGSAVGNVATTGTFTIPLMKRLGYPGALAGAVEAVASTGGQLAPPIMGAAAFIMAEIIGVDYVKIAAAALLPALLFYAGVFGTVHVIAQQQNLGRVPEDQMPGWPDVLRADQLAPVLLAFVGLAYGILTGRSIQFAAFLGIVGTLAGMLVGRALHRRPDAEPVAAMLRTALQEGGRSLVIVGILLAGAQVLVTMINMTGIGVTLSSMIIEGAGARLLTVGAIVALVCMVMGMGIPTTAAYVLVAATLAPALVKAGVEPLAAHMFVFYFATLSVITPPVCVGVFVASGIAGVDWISVARRAMALGAVTYVIPFLFLLYPGMLQPSLDLAYAEAIVSGLVFVTAAAYLFGGARITGLRWADIVLWGAVAAVAVVPHAIALAAATFVLMGLIWMRRPAPIGHDGSGPDRAQVARSADG